MVTAKRSKKRKLNPKELFFLWTPEMANKRKGGAPKKGAIVHLGRKLTDNKTIIIACGRDLGRTFEAPYHAFTYPHLNICLKCEKAIVAETGEIPL